MTIGVRRSIRSATVLVLALTLAACAPKDAQTRPLADRSTSTSTSTSGPVASTSGPMASDLSTSDPSTSDPSTTGTSTPAPRPSPANRGPFCQQVADGMTNAFGQAPQTQISPDVLRRQVEVSRQKNEAALASAPNDLQADLRTLFGVSNRFTDLLARANYDVTKIAPGATSGFNTPDVRAASARVLAYLKDKCGIDLLNSAP